MRGKDPYHLRVRDIVKKDVVTIADDDSLQTALELMAENRLSALPVLDGMIAASESSRLPISWRLPET